MTAAAGVIPVLMRVLLPLADQLRQQPDASGVARVLAAVPSPADIAAALTATLTALHTILYSAVHGTCQSGPYSGSDVWHLEPYLRACSTIVRALAKWLPFISSRGSNTASVSVSVAEGSAASSWGAAQDTWRCALQEFGTCSALREVSVCCLMLGLSAC